MTEERRRSQRVWYSKNRERVCAKKRRWKRENKQKVREAWRIYRNANIETLNRKAREYHQANPEKRREKARQRYKPKARRPCLTPLELAARRAAARREWYLLNAEQIRVKYYENHSAMLEKAREKYRNLDALQKTKKNLATRNWKRRKQEEMDLRRQGARLIQKLVALQSVSKTINQQTESAL